MTGKGRTLVRSLALVLALALVVLGTVNIIGSLGRDSLTVDEVFRGVRVVDVEVDVESVEVLARRGSSTQLERVIAWSLKRPTISQRREGDRLVVRSSCPAQIGRGCSGTVRLLVPPDTEVRASSSAGSVRVVGLAGTVQLDSSAGSVEAIDLFSANLSASSSAGSVSLSFAAAPTLVSATSSAGTVEVLVPRGNETYRVDAGSSAGSSDVSVRTDPGSPRVLRARSSAGSVRIDYRRP